jgi:hypothetical protein
MRAGARSRSVDERFQEGRRPLMSRAGLVSLIAMMQGCFSPEVGDDDIVGCIEDAACKADRVCRDRQCVAADDDDDSEEPDDVPPPDACEWNHDCASGCCQPALLDGDAAGWGECRPADECVATCEPADCDIDWCVGTSTGECLVSWYDDGACDCGCQFVDVDCE